MRMGTKKRPAARTTAPIASLLIALTVARSIDAPLPCLTVSITARKRPPCDTLRAAGPGLCRLWRILAQKAAGMGRRPPHLALPNGTGIIVDRGGTAMPPLKMLILGFAAGFIATLIFHQGLWSVFNHTGVIPPDRPAWPVDPIPPFGIPSVLSKAFWGGPVSYPHLRAHETRHDLV